MNHVTNAQQVYSLVALFTCLEALLGVINACLPVLRPIFSKLSGSAPSAWLSSVMSGTITIFMRQSQLGSRWATPSTARNESAVGHEMPEMPRRPRGHERAPVSSPLPRCEDDTAANMVFPSSAANVRGLSSSSPTQSRGPRVPPKADEYGMSPTRNSDRKNYGKGIRVQTEWDVKRGISEESDRQPLDPRRDYTSRW